MKKITLIAALLGSAYFANAQVGIGTPTPHASAILDVEATDKGVLIPRVALKNTTTVLSTGLVQEESLLVYNTAKVADVTPGFYYWVAEKGSVDAHWERVVNQTQLNQAISNQGGDITKIKDLLDAAYGSNNLGDNATSDSFGGMVFTPADGSNAAKFEYVKWNSTSNSYERLDITSVITDLIKGSESKTLLFATTDKKKQYYISETYLVNTTNPVTQAMVDGWATGTVPTGVYEINFIEGVSTNIQTILDQTVTIIEDGKTFNTVEQYIQYIASKSDANVGFTVGGIDATDNNGVAIPANSFYYIDKTTGNKVHIDLAALVKDLETDTQITKNVTGTVNAGDVKIDYKYFNEAQPDTNGTPQQVIDLNADLKTLIEGNTEIKNAISNVLNQGGNVYYGDVNGTNVFYTIDASGNKVAIEISQVVVNAITNATTIQKQEIKNQLGDTYSTTTVVNTGDTWIDGGKIYKGIYETNVLGGTANITGASTTTAGFVTIVGDVSDINVIGIRIIGENGVSASATDLSVDGKKIYFRIGTGSMYNVLSANDLTVKVLVEFSANTTTP